MRLRALVKLMPIEQKLMIILAREIEWWETAGNIYCSKKLPYMVKSVKSDSMSLCDETIIVIEVEKRR